MLSKYLTKILDEALNATNINNEFEKLMIHSLGSPPNIIKENDKYIIKEMPQSPDMSVIEKIVKLHSLQNKVR